MVHYFYKHITIIILIAGLLSWILLIPTTTFAVCLKPGKTWPVYQGKPPNDSSG